MKIEGKMTHSGGGGSAKSIVNVEVYQSMQSKAKKNDLKTLAAQFLASIEHRLNFSNQQTFSSKDFAGNEDLLKHIVFIDVSTSGWAGQSTVQLAEVNYFISKLDEHGKEQITSKKLLQKCVNIVVFLNKPAKKSSVIFHLSKNVLT